MVYYFYICKFISVATSEHLVYIFLIQYSMFFNTCIHIMYISYYLYTSVYVCIQLNLEQHKGLGCWSLHTQKSHLTLQLDFSVQDSAFLDSTNHKLYSTVVHIYWKKNSHISGTVQFKSIWFKGQLFM